jgi:hypothetical protein
MVRAEISSTCSIFIIAVAPRLLRAFAFSILAIAAAETADSGSVGAKAHG